MWRALQLAKNGEGHVSPNPMVGAVIVYQDKIIGEGFHRAFGSPHAEVNAINSIKKSDKELLSKSTLYVTLEPCSHYGKTPPCANLIVNSKIPEVVIGAKDPNPLVAGNGIKFLRSAGIMVKIGVLEKECEELNKNFYLAHTTERPRIILKWAQSADGYMAATEDDGEPSRVVFSNPVSTVWMHRERSKVDAITVGKNTLRIDNPKLDVRFWGGNSPKKIIIDKPIDCCQFVENLRREGITSLMVEGGPTLLKSFIEQGLYDEIRIEISPLCLFKGLRAPQIPHNLILADNYRSRENDIFIFRR